MSRSFQVAQIFPSLTVGENVRAAAAVAGVARGVLAYAWAPVDSPAIRSKADATMELRLPTSTTAAGHAEARLAWIFSVMPEVAALRSRRTPELSGGQQKMVALARR